MVVKKLIDILKKQGFKDDGNVHIYIHSTLSYFVMLKKFCQNQLFCQKIKKKTYYKNKIYKNKNYKKQLFCHNFLKLHPLFSKKWKKWKFLASYFAISNYFFIKKNFCKNQLFCHKISKNFCKKTNVLSYFFKQHPFFKLEKMTF